MDERLFVQFDLDPLLVTAAKKDGRYDVMLDGAAFMEALLNEVKRANVNVSHYRVVIEAVPDGEKALFDPLHRDCDICLTSEEFHEAMYGEPSGEPLPFDGLLKKD